LEDHSDYGTSSLSFSGRIKVKTAVYLYLSRSSPPADLFYSGSNHDDDPMKELYDKVFPSPYALSRSNWKIALNLPNFKLKAAVSLLILISIGIFIPRFFGFIQNRPGIILNDAFLNLFEPQNVSWVIFPLLYVSLFLTFLNLIPLPHLFIKGVQAFAILLLIRIVCLYFVPLEPATRYIPLQDPLIGRAFYSGTLITKDLFFSGHVSTMFLLFLINPAPALKYFLMIATALVACLILFQHVHYTVDVIAAPVFAWISYRLAVRFF
jgi:hypothetical protein